jgi:hypothetical protein
MSKSLFQASVLTANRLGDGIVVFLDFEGAWNENLAEALVARSPEEVKALEDRAVWDATRSLVVEPYLVEVREAAGGVVPIRYRERVRAGGPSILDDVPGYAAPIASPRPSSTPPQAPSAREEREGEGRQRTPEPEAERLVA